VVVDDGGVVVVVVVFADVDHRRTGNSRSPPGVVQPRGGSTSPWFPVRSFDEGDVVPQRSAGEGDCRIWDAGMRVGSSSRPFVRHPTGGDIHAPGPLRATTVIESGDGGCDLIFGTPTSTAGNSPHMPPARKART
jgi:hypothetical protein